MKKIFALLCAIAALTVTVSAEEDIAVLVNGSKVEFDQPPIIINDRTIVPMRAIFEKLNLMVQWFEDEKRITATDDNVNITMFIGIPLIYVNGEEHEIDAVPIIVNGRTLIPLRAIGESVGGKVEWDGVSRTVTIEVEEHGDEDSSDEALERKILELTNAERAVYGIPPLTWNEKLAEIARAHSRDMVERGFFSHDNPDGKTPFDRLRDAGIKYTCAAENVAAGQSSPEKAVSEWMKSEGHKMNILNPALKELGVGLARGGEYGIYWTQNFAELR